MALQDILDRLQDVRSSGDSYRAQCPCEHKSSGQLSLKELYDGRILMHGHCGHSAGEILEAVGMKLSNLFEEPLDKHIRPLFQIRQDKKKLATIYDKVKACQLRLDLAKDMREQGIKLTKADMITERDAFTEMRQLQEQL